MTDYTVGATIHIAFTTRAFATGIPTVLIGTAGSPAAPVVVAYEDADLTEITAGITLGVDHDSRVGLNMLTIVATGGNGFEIGKDYNLVITNGTVDSVSVVGEVVGSFTLGRAAAAVWDQILSGATHNVTNSAGRRLRQIQENLGYEGGAVWIDTVNGVAGTENFENGTVDNPVSNLADANTLATSLGLTTFRLESGSSITLVATQMGQVFIGINWILALGGQSVVGSFIDGATVSGIASGTGTTQEFRNCIMNAASHVKGTHLVNCAIAGKQTAAEAGDYFLDQCHSAIAGVATWIWEFGDAIGNTNLNVRHHSGGIQLESMGDTGTDTASIEGHGQIIEGTCTGGVVAVRGNFTLSGITNLTMSDDARYDVIQIKAEADSALADYDGPTNAEMEARTLAAGPLAQLSQNLDDCFTGTASGTPTTTTMISDIGVTEDNQFKGRIITFDDDTTTAALRKQSTDITGGTASSNTLAFTALTTAPVSGDTFVIT